MAFAGLLTLLDDIAVLLDDVAVLTKLAAKKSAGVLGDDLALNAQQVTGVASARELPVVWAVAKGSFRNKAILVPAALLISALLPVLITPLLMLGGAFLCFEGAEKILHHFFPHGPKQEQAAEPADESSKIQGAIRTDFILSAEIMAIVLGVVDGKPLLTQAAVLTALAIAMTVLVYGIVALIVKLDDFGLWLTGQSNAAWQRLGKGILWAAPGLMKLLSIVGMAAMFLVGGGILVHGVPFIHHAVQALALQWTGNADHTLVVIAGNALVGVVAGVVIVAVVSAMGRIRKGLR